MKTILYINHISEIGGSGLCLLEIVKRLDRKNYKPIVLLKMEGPLVFELKKLDVDVYIENSLSITPYNKSLLNIVQIKQLLSLVLSFKRIWRWMQKTDAEIVSFNTMMMYPYSILSHFLGIKSIVHMREHWSPNEHRLQFMFARYIINRYADKVVAINKTSSKILNLQSKTTIVYDWNNFDGRDEFFNMEKYGLDSSKEKLFLYLGGMQGIKGALEIATIFKELKHIKNIRLVFVGGKSNLETKKARGIAYRFLKRTTYIQEQYEERVREVIAQSEGMIVTLPKVFNIKSLIEQSYCFVSFITMPHAILPLAEFAWSGKPSVAVDTPEAREYTNNGTSAILVPMGDTKKFKDAIQKINNSHDLVEKLKKEGPIFAKERFDPIRNSNILNKLYSEI